MGQHSNQKGFFAQKCLFWQRNYPADALKTRTIAYLLGSKLAQTLAKLRKSAFFANLQNGRPLLPDKWTIFVQRRQRVGTAILTGDGARSVPFAQTSLPFSSPTRIDPSRPIPAVGAFGPHGLMSPNEMRPGERPQNNLVAQRICLASREIIWIS
jgi:hypothetical protein